MHRLSIALMFALLVLPLTGCVESEDVVTLNMDGRGTVHSTYVTDLVKHREFLLTLTVLGIGTAEQLAKATEEELSNVEHPAWARMFASKVKGYEITKGTQEFKDKKRTTSIESRFTNMDAAAKGGAFSAFNVELSQVKKSEKVPSGGWKFVISTPLGGSAEDTGGFDIQAMLPQFEPQLNTMKTSLKLILPTKILDTNGQKSADGKSVSWAYTFDDLMDTDADTTMTVVFEAADNLKLKPFKREADITALSTRGMQMPPKKFMQGSQAGASKTPSSKTEEKKTPEGKDTPAAPVTTPSTPKSPTVPKTDGGK